MGTHITLWYNSKGGVSKTTSCMALADGLAIRGYKVLVVDMTGQVNISEGYGNLNLNQYGIWDVLCKPRFNIRQAIQQVPQEYFGDLEIKGKVDIIPGTVKSMDLQKDLAASMMKEEKLLRAFAQLDNDEYDYILIDTDPLFLTDIIITNAMLACDDIILPIKLEPFSISGINKVRPRIEFLYEQGINEDLTINGIFCTQVIGRRISSNENGLDEIEKYAQANNIYIYENYTNNRDDAVKAQKNKKSIYVPEKKIVPKKNKNGDVIGEKIFKKKYELAKDYDGFVDEYIERCKRGN